jgi:methanogenic corrinoid protein MtbC1
MSRRSLTPHAPGLADAQCWSDGVVPMTSVPGGLTANAQGGLSWLLNTLEKEVLPRLLQAHAHSEAGPDKRPTITDNDVPRTVVQQLVQMALTNDTADMLAYVQAIHAQGVALETVYLHVLTPVARTLGEMWERDECTFTDVTVGLWRIKQVMHELSPTFQSVAQEQSHGREVMLVPTPGSAHNLGLFMVSEFFRRSGWRVSGELLSQPSDMLHAVQKDWIDLVGLSVGISDHVAPLADLIKALRGASRNPALQVMVGGPLMLAHPEYVSLLGADFMAVDAPTAVNQAEARVPMRNPR